MNRGMGRTRRVSRIGAVLLALGVAPHVMADNELGQAVSNLGGNRMLVNAANAIYTTCVGLATFNGSLSPDQQVLGGRCADMTQQGFTLSGNGNAAVPAFDTFGLSGQANGNATYLGLLRQFTGEEVSSQGRYATEGVVSQFKGVAARLGAIRRGLRMPGLTLNLNGSDVLANADGSVTAPMLTGGSASADEQGDTGFAWFANVDYGFGDRDSTSFEDGYDSNSWGGLVGVDYGFNAALVAGAALSFDHAKVDFNRSASGSVSAVSGGNMDSDSWTFSGFVNYLAERNYASAIVSYGRTSYDMSRDAVIPLATSSSSISGGLPAASAALKSDTDSDQYGAQGQVGRTFGATAATFDLYGGANYLHVTVDGFTEHGSPLALRFGSQTIKSFQGFLGGTLRRSFNTGSGVVVPYLTAEYRHEFKNDSRTLSARYVGTVRAPNDTFQGQTDNFLIPTDSPDKDYFSGTLGVSMQLANSMAVFGEFTGLLGLEHTSANVVTLGIRGRF